MERDADPDETDADAGLITGACDHCEWTDAANSYPALIAAYQDHLREKHPTAWLHA